MSRSKSFLKPLFSKRLHPLSGIEGGWSLPEKGGGAFIGGRWYTEHALERMAPDTLQVRAMLEPRILKRAHSGGFTPQTDPFGEWIKTNGASPRGVPPLVVEAEIKNCGSTNIQVILNEKGHVITVIPGGK